MAVDAEAAAVRNPCGFVVMLLVLVFGLPAPSAESLSMEIAGKTQTMNGNVTISCKSPHSPHLDIKSMSVIWFQKNLKNLVGGIDAEVLFGTHRKAFQSGANVPLQGLAKGDTSLQLPEVQLREAGEYRCTVVNTPDEGQGTVFLEVIACPVSSLSVQEAKVKDNDGLRLLCKASGFYPEGINITWYKWNQETFQCLNISENIITNAAIKNEDNTFNVTSTLILKHPPEHNATYGCAVQHIPLSVSWWCNMTLPENGSETKRDLRNLLKIIVPCLLVGLAGPIVLILVCIRFRSRFRSPGTVV